MNRIIIGLIVFAASVLARAAESPRATTSLDGEWRIVFDRTDEGRGNEWWKAGALEMQPPRTIQVPSCWEEIEKDYEGVAWYQRKFSAPAEWKGRAVRLQFDAANYFSEVWLNGEPVGDHEGGYTPFEFDVTDQLAYGRENVLVVRVAGPAILTERVGFMLRDEAPHWRGGYVGGLWQPVRLVESHPVFTRDVFVEPDVNRRRVRVRVTLENITLQPAAVEVTVSADATQLREALTVPPGGLEREFELAIPDPQLWSPDSPHLYTARVAIAANGKTLDEHSTRFGMREFTVRDGRFCLNGKPFFIKGAFWEGQYPSTLAHPKNAEIVRKEIQMAKAAGFNLLRPWRMPPVPMTLDLADELGVLLTGAPPIECMNQWPALTPQLERRWTREMEQMIRRDRNHPSVILWETGNEVIRRPLYLLRHKVSLAARRLDPTRLVIDESGGDSWSYGGNQAWRHPDAFDGLTFARGPHFYLPGSTTPQRFEDHHINHLPAPINAMSLQRIASVGTNAQPAWVSEFSYGGFPDLARNVARYRREGNPLAPDYRFHERLLASLERVMDEHGLRDLFPDASALCQASQQVQADANKLLIEALRLNPRIGGFCMHAFTDGDWVVGAGILDMWREPKRQYRSVQEANKPLLLTVRATPQNIYAETGARVVVSAVNEGPAAQAELVVTLDGATWQVRRAVKLDAGITSLLDEPLPAESLRGPQTIQAKLVQGDQTLAESPHSIFVVGREELTPGVKAVALFDPQNKLAAFFERRGVTVRPLKAESAPEGPAIVAFAEPRNAEGLKTLAALLRHVQHGATAIWLQVPSATNQLVTANVFPFAPNHQPAKGMWIPVNHYTRPHAVFDGLPAGGFMGQVYQNVVPQFTLLGLSGTPLAGCVSWDHNKDYTGPTEVWHGTDLTVLPHGRGRLVLSTLNLIEHLGADPVADKLLLNLCRWSAVEMKPGPGRKP
jgi:hypothetical protein